MAENKVQTVRRVPRVESVKSYGFDPHTGKAVVRTRLRTFYDFAIMQLPSHGIGSRVPVAIIEDASYADVKEFLAAPPTERGYSRKGFHKVKQKA